MRAARVGVREFRLGLADFVRFRRAGRSHPPWAHGGLLHSGEDRPSS